VDNGSLLLKGVRKYILSDRDFDNFELSLQWRVAPGGNSGILFHCVNDGPDLHQYSPEYQIVDNAAMTKAIELAGSVFALYAAPPEAVRAVGEWNDSRLVVEGKRVKHWLNGRKVVEYELGSPDFLARVARSSFQKDAFAQRSSGAIALQGWIGSAWFQNVKIRRLSPGSLVGADGKWKLSPGAPPPAIAPFDEKKAKEHQAAWAKHLGVPLEITNSMGMKLVLIPPGEFMMGSPKELIEEELGTHSEGWYTKYLPSEGPRHRVRITRAFWLGAYDVTQEEYERVMGANPSEFSASGNGKDKVAGRDTKHHPVEMVSWEDTTEFCVRLSNLPEEKAAGRRYRLPTEAQWEYACRAGTTTRWYCGDDEAALDECAWYHKNSGDMTQPVGQKRPNGWGLYDMHGNVWQWCADWHGADYYAKSSADDPSGPPEGSHHANRGGSWRHPPWQCRSAIRHDLPGSRHGSLGFRVSLVLADK
jgi:formylglycine-generating enzyme required for sulfatase activity